MKFIPGTNEDDFWNLNGTDQESDQIFGYLGNDRLRGLGSNDTLDGGGGDDTLDGGAGIDRMIGGLGDDTYWVDNASDVVVEAGASGNDWVYSTVDYTLGAFVENLSLNIGSAIRGTGNSLDNVIHGNSSNNVLDGRLGDDELQGGLGLDTLLGGDGNDTIYGKGENQWFGFGADTANRLSGDAGDDYLIGGEGDDTINGGTGDDSALGGAGRDGISGDAGNDSLYGEAGRDTLRGGDGDDLLDGGGAVGELDYLEGGQGNDTYVMAIDYNDSIVDSGGIDTAMVGFTEEYLLPASIENAIAFGGAFPGVHIVGNSLNNQMTAPEAGQPVTFEGGAGNDRISGSNKSDFLDGGSGNDVLDGRDSGAQQDTLVGGAGNDTYYINEDPATSWRGPLIDVVTEAVGGGTDQVFSDVNYVLADNVERLTLAGTARTGVGNTLANVVTGNGLANILEGGAGNDSVSGGAGRDTLYGGLNGKTPLNGIDTLTGGEGNDVFAMANRHTRFYDDGVASSAGRNHYALITDFTVGQDRLQLAGTASNYYLGASGVDGVAGTGLWAEQGATDELIAIVRSANSTALNADNTIKTGLFV